MGFSVNAQQGSRRITGSIKTTDGTPFPGVNIIAKGTSVGVISDFDGNYEINVPASANVLIFSYVGYISQEIGLSDSDTVDIVLQEGATNLDEVVIVGYGTARKSDLTGSVVSVKTEELNLGVVPSVETALSGRAAGVQVTQLSGEPGAGAVVRIRGTNSISGNNEPLFVIDGVPLINGGLNALNPDDIASLEVLKDASSTAIYGSRGANGVILVTTKSGALGKPKLTFSTYAGFQTLANKIELTNARQWAELENENFEFLGVPDRFDLDSVQSAVGNGTDWQEALFRTATVRNYQVNLSGGTENSNYFLSANHFDQEGIVRESKFQRNSIRANISGTIADKLTIGTNLNLTRSETDGVLLGTGGQSVVQLALRANPLIPVREEDGSFSEGIFLDSDDQNFNPIATLQDETREQRENRFVGDFYVDYELFQGLNFRSSFGVDFQDIKNSMFLPASTPLAQGRSTAMVTQASNFYWVSNNILTFNKDFGEKHSFNVTAGFTAERSKAELLSARGTDFPTDVLGFNNLGIAEPSTQTIGSGLTEFSLVSVLGRVNYIYDDRYLFTLTARNDGSSRFPENNKYSFFPSAAIGWNVSNESFMENVDFISQLKFRASYGRSGEQGIAPYQSFATLSPFVVPRGSGGPGEDALGFSVDSFANEDLKWETTDQLDLGLDLGLFNNRLRITFDYYEKTTKDLLLERPLPLTTGVGTALSNVGSLENKGFEFEIDAVITNGDFRWNATLNLAKNENTVLDLNLGEDTEFLQPNNGVFQGNTQANPTVLIEGQPIGIFFGYQTDGVYQSQEEIDNSGLEVGPQGTDLFHPGALRIVDINGDGLITPDDRTVIGNAIPDFYGGLINNFAYKNFDLTVLSQWSVGNDIYWIGRAYNTDPGLGDNFLRSYYDNRWSPSNPTGTEPRSGYNSRVFPDTDYRIEDGSYFRIKNITLGYTIPWKFDSKLRIYGSVDNVITFTNYPGYNPDVSSFQRNSLAQGVDSGAFPLATTVTLGLNFNL
ncbi:MAG: TonB-dependent receptor [Bacteroidota bacterium]